MTPWTPDDLALLTGARTLLLTAGDDGHPGVEVGMVLLGGELYVRAHRGIRSRWYQAARDHGHGRVRVGAVTRDVLLTTGDGGPAHEIDAAYRSKYGRTADAFVTGPVARAATVRIRPVPSMADGAAV
ncbi:DUF2255 family protein [Streptomyces sp. NPDC006997]|uniref:DUF2255 family protein n=1 Tax=Streptomyces sp. NPDC006997 TaxID=3155356 RepID=UPI0033F47DBC